MGGAAVVTSRAAAADPDDVARRLRAHGAVRRLRPAAHADRGLPSRRWRWWANATVAALVVCLAGIMLLPGGAHLEAVVNSEPFDGRSFTGALAFAVG